MPLFLVQNFLLSSLASKCTIVLINGNLNAAKFNREKGDSASLLEITVWRVFQEQLKLFYCFKKSGKLIRKS